MHIACTVSPLFTWTPFTGVKELRAFLWRHIKKQSHYNAIFIVVVHLAYDCCANNMKFWVSKNYVYIYIYIYMYICIYKITYIRILIRIRIFWIKTYFYFSQIFRLLYIYITLHNLLQWLWIKQVYIHSRN